jgi:hypothetical protein
MNMAGQVGSFLSSVAFGYAVSFLRDHHFTFEQQFNWPVYPLAAMLIVSGILFFGIDATRSVVDEDTDRRPLASLSAKD